MIDNFAPKLARVLTEYSCPVQKGALVVIVSTTAAAPLIEALYEAILARGGHPVVQASLPNLNEIYLRNATDEQLAFCDPFGLYIMDKADVLFQIIAPVNTRSRSQIPAERIAKSQQGSRPIMEKYMSRLNDQSLRWNITAWPTQASAQEAEMGLLAYSEFIYQACALDQDDPIAFWKAFQNRQTKLAGWLEGKSHAEVRGPGIEMSFDFTGRPWVSCHGTVNFPDGEIFTSPIEDSVNGHVAFSYPTMHGGREVSGIELTFKDGRATGASAAKGEEYLLAQLDIDAGARTLGEFAIGTNMGIQRFTGQTLFDEKIGGSIHMALGESISESKGVNKSAIHWDIVHSMRDGGEIWIDGELFYQSGDFVIEGK
ncbi:aminopeptidase [Aggregatilinea lenta]|uniref:aminopeptidase n=1 Tax=Aggregatilinea lenta TaxID=913108 RepID=UPI000E5ABF62|nr:aminopeptidase [Aggregatilinea lenta]